VSGVVGGFIGWLVRFCQGNAAQNNGAQQCPKVCVQFCAVAVIVGILLSSLGGDRLPCDRGGGSFEATAVDMKECDTSPFQQFASRGGLGAFLVPVTATVQLASALGTLDASSGAFTPRLACNAQLTLGAPLLEFNQFFTSGGQFALTPPDLCPGAFTGPGAGALPSALASPQGYGAVLHAWVGYRAPTGVEQRNARVTLELTSSTSSLPPRPPAHWQRNTYPPRLNSSLSGGRFILSQGSDAALNPFLASDDSATVVCAAKDTTCAGVWALGSIARLRGAGSAFLLPLGTLGGQRWAWQVSPQTTVAVSFGGDLKICPK
jgi:hypothetical protein